VFASIPGLRGEVEYPSGRSMIEGGVPSCGFARRGVYERMAYLLIEVDWTLFTIDGMWIFDFARPRRGESSVSSSATEYIRG
jgi:hypothetical protein